MGCKKLNIAPGVKLTQSQAEHLYIWGEYGYTPAKISTFYEPRTRPKHYAVRDSLRTMLGLGKAESRLVQDKKARDFYMIYKYSIASTVPEDLKLEIVSRRYEGIDAEY